MRKIGVIGDKDSVLGFKALGLEVFTPEKDADVRTTIETLAKKEYGVIFITEQMAVKALETISRYDGEVIPAIIMIPSNSGTLNIGSDRINKNVEKALGSNIL